MWVKKSIHQNCCDQKLDSLSEQISLRQAMPHITPLHEWFNTVTAFLLSPRMTPLKQNIYMVSFVKILREKIIKKYLQSFPVMYSLIKTLIKMLMKNLTENEKTHKCVQKVTCATPLAIAFKEASIVTLYITFFFPLSLFP